MEPSGDDAVTTEAAAAVEKPAPKKGLKLSYDEYKQMANLLVCHMRKAEETAEGENAVLKVTRYWLEGHLLLALSTLL